jgi:hypothetical protein
MIGKIGVGLLIILGFIACDNEGDYSYYINNKSSSKITLGFRPNFNYKKTLDSLILMYPCLERTS